METCFQKLEKILKQSEARRKDRLKERQEQQQEELDDYEPDVLGEEDEEENEMVDEVNTAQLLFNTHTFLDPFLFCFFLFFFNWGFCVCQVPCGYLISCGC